MKTSIWGSLQVNKMAYNLWIPTINYYGNLSIIQFFIGFPLEFRTKISYFIGHIEPECNKKWTLSKQGKIEENLNKL